MSFGDSIGNPGDLTVGTSTSLVGNGFLYPGQSGIATANGFSYAQFPNSTIGSNALVNYVTRHIASGWNTVSSFVFGFLGTSTDNAANPNVQNYLQAVENATGLSANSTITAADATNIAAGISRAEGSKSFVSATSSLSGAITSLPGSFVTGVNALVSNPLANIPNLVTANVSALSNFGGNASTVGGTVGQAASDVTSGAITAAGKSIQGGLTSVGTAITNATSPITSLFNNSTLERTIFIILGVLLLAAALFTLVKSYGPSPAQIAAVAA